MKTPILFILLLQLLLATPFSGKAFGVLTHEAIIDAAWEQSIVPLLKQRFPLATSEEIKEAHAYAYGGAVAPDMGYYPAGSKFFTDLVHYVRSGEMVTSLFTNAANINQYAFAIGFLSHYNADNYGHSLATNRSVGLVYPKLAEKFGSSINYAQNKIGHVRMEFGFDVLQVARGNYASLSYRDFIGFKVDTAVLSKAFSETYGLDINKVFSNHFGRSVETFRWVVANVFPLLTRQAWASKKGTIKQTDSTSVSTRFRYKMRQKNYNKEYGTGYRRPGFFPSFLSFVIRALPKVGPTRPLKFKLPTPEAEKYFIQSFDTILHHFTGQIKLLSSPEGRFKNINFDTGNPTEICEYILADRTYNALVLQLHEQGIGETPALLRRNIINYYKNISLTKNRNAEKKCMQFFTALAELKQ